MPAVEPKSEKKPSTRSIPDPAPEGPQLEHSEGAPAGLPRFMGAEAPDAGASPIFLPRRARSSAPQIQPKLTVGPVDDPLEEEADRIADRVTGMPASGFASSPPPPPKREPTAGNPASGPSGGSAPKIVRDVLRSDVQDVLRTAGQPLDQPTRAYFEPRFGRDFSDVRVHADAPAGHSAQAIRARAYTAGSDVVFAPGQFSPGSAEGKKLLAHELTHVVQQNGSDKIARKSDDEADIRADQYRTRFADEIGNGVVQAVNAMPLETGSRYLTLIGPLQLGSAILGVDGAALTEKINGWLGPGRLNVLIDKARVKGRETVEEKGEETRVEEKAGEGPARWFPDVGVEVAQAVYKLLFESLARITPRYIQAAVAIGIAEEERQQKSLTQVPSPTPFDIVPSYPIDINTIVVLTRSGTFAYQAYRAANPTDRGKIGKVRPVSFYWETPRTGSYWIRVSAPADPTAEEVANALYGSPTFAGQITVSAAPLFGIANASSLLPAHRQALASLGVDVAIGADPLQDALTGPLHDEIAKNQAAGPSSLLTKGDVVRTIDQNLMILDSIAQSGGRFGMDQGAPIQSVSPLKQTLEDRRTTLMAGSDEEALTWASQAEAQQSVLTDISFAYDTHVTRLDDLTKMVQDAAVKIGGFNLPPYVRTAMFEVAMKFADAAAASDLPASARALLAEAEERAGTLPVEFLEGALTSIQRVIDDARTAKADAGRWAGYDVAGMQEREQKYKLALAKIRAEIRSDPAAAVKDLGEVQKLILDLQTESETVGNMDAIDGAWKALDDAYSVWFSSLGTTLILRMLKQEGDAYHARWSAIHKAYKSGSAADKGQAKADLDTLRAELPTYFGKVKGAVKSAQIEAMIGRLAALLVIGIVTMGVGDLVAAGALGADLAASAWAVGGAEAIVFTGLSQVFLDNNHSFGHIVFDFATNWAMFGVMRQFQAFAEVAKLGPVAKVGGAMVMMTAMTLAKAELDKYIQDGRTLNKAELKQMALQGIVLAIAMHAIGPLVKPMFAELEGEAYAFGSKLKANNIEVRALKAKSDALSGNKSLGEAQKYVAAEKAWLEQRLQVLEEVQAQLEKEQADPSAKKGAGIAGKIKMSPKQVADLKASLQATLAKVTTAEQPLRYLTPKAPGLYSCPREQIAGIVDTLGKTTKITEEHGVKTYEIVTPEGKTIKVVEEVDPKTQWVQDAAEPLDAAARAEAVRLLDLARAEEPAVTASLEEAARSVNGQLEGKEHMFKTEESLARKLRDRAASLPTASTDPQGAVRKVSPKVNDALRYTVSAEPGNYIPMKQRAYAILKSKGYTLEWEWNAWGDKKTPYRGTNSTWRTPKGQLFEVQFHTPESYAVKSSPEVRAMYEEARASGTSPERRAELERLMYEKYGVVTPPPGVELNKP